MSAILDRHASAGWHPCLWREAILEDMGPSLRWGDETLNPDNA